MSLIEEVLEHDELILNALHLLENCSLLAVSEIDVPDTVECISVCNCKSEVCIKIVSVILDRLLDSIDRIDVCRLDVHLVVEVISSNLSAEN